MKKTTIFGIFIYLIYAKLAFAELPPLPNINSVDPDKILEDTNKESGKRDGQAEKEDENKDIKPYDTPNNTTNYKIPEELPEELYLPSLDEIDQEHSNRNNTNPITIPEQKNEEILPSLPTQLAPTESEKLILPKMEEVDKNVPPTLPSQPDSPAQTNIGPVTVPEQKNEEILPLVPTQLAPTESEKLILPKMEEVDKNAGPKPGELEVPREEIKASARSPSIPLGNIPSPTADPKKEEVFKSTLPNNESSNIPPLQVTEPQKDKKDILSKKKDSEIVKEDDFVHREVAVLKLANDEVTLGQLTKVAEIKYMDFLSYASLYKKLLSQEDNKIASNKVDKFIKNTATKLRKDMDPTLVKLIMEDDPDFFLSFSDNDIAYLSILAAKSNDLELLRLMIDNYYTLDIYDDEKNNLLMIAIINNNKKIVSYLLHKGIDLNISNIHGETAFSLATKKNLPSIVQMLKNAGAFDDIYLDDIEMPEDFNISF